MLINGKNYTIDDLLNKTNFEDNFLTKANENFYLTKYQVSVLERLKIDYNSLSTLKELIYIMNDVYEETLDEELDIILNEISERDYYENTKK